MTTFGMAAAGVSDAAPATRICGALHFGQKGMPSSMLAPHL
jgi:hypothetical protein